MNQRKRRYTPMEVARILGISTAKFSAMVSDELLPKGRIGEDGKRYYTDQDIEFIQRAWKSKITGRFIMVTMPLILLSLALVAAVLFHFISSDDGTGNEDTRPRGYALPPTPIPTADPLLTTPTPEMTPRANRRINYYESRKSRDDAELDSRNDPSALE